MVTDPKFSTHLNKLDRLIDYALVLKVQIH